MSDEMLLLMAQVDDVPGELIGDFIQRASTLGARNVQVLPSITKKNRPGYVIYVDAPQSLEPEIATLFGAELGAWGYRVIAAEHKHFDIERFTTRVNVRSSGGKQEFELRAKRISKAGVFSRIKVEYDDLSVICDSLRENGMVASLSDVKAAVESELRIDNAAKEISISI